MSELIVALGSNLGDSAANINAAIREIERLMDGPVTRSSLWRSEAKFMNDDSGDFVNAVVRGETRLAPLAVLRGLQAIEVELGRPSRHGVNMARTIDLDLLIYADEPIDLPDLKVPHPRMLERLFVLLPLQEILPDYVSSDGRSIVDLIATAPDIEISRL